MPKMGLPLVRALPQLHGQLGSRVIEGFFAGLAKAGKLHPASNLRRHDVEVIRNLPYRETGDPEHTLDVYRSTVRQQPLPILL